MTQSKPVKTIFISSLLFLMFVTPSLAQHEHGRSSMSNTFGYADSVNLGLILKDTLRGSPLRKSMTTIAGNHIHIEYGSPGVKGRIIWGGLLPLNQVWAAGAHNATTFNFYKDVVIDGKKIKKGTYAFFIIPREANQKWTLVLNKNYEQHLADEYNKEDDVLRLEVDPIWSDSKVERLTYQVEKIAEKEGKIVFKWEKLSLVLPFMVK